MTTITRAKTTKYKNLRGIMDELRTNTAKTVILAKQRDNDGGLLIIQFQNGTLAQSTFASFTVMQQWVKNRRALKDVETHVV